MTSTLRNIDPASGSSNASSVQAVADSDNGAPVGLNANTPMQATHASAKSPVNTPADSPANTYSDIVSLLQGLQMQISGLQTQLVLSNRHW